MKKSTAVKVCDQILDCARTATKEVTTEYRNAEATFTPFNAFAITGTFHAPQLKAILSEVSPTLTDLRVSYSGSRRKFLEHLSEAVDDISIEMLAVTKEHLLAVDSATKLTPKMVRRAWNKFGKSVRNMYLESL